MNTEPLPSELLAQASSTAPRPVLDENATTPAAREAIARFGREIVDHVRATVAREPIVVVGMAQNPFVRRVRTALKEAQLEFSYLEYGSYLHGWKDRLAIKMWSGWSTFPQVFVRGKLIGGFEDTRAALADGSLRAWLDAKP